MANLFKSIVIARQQLRYLPRFSQSWPEKNLPTNSPSVQATEDKSEDSSSAKFLSDKKSSYPKIKWKYSSNEDLEMPVKSIQSKESSVKKLKKKVEKEISSTTKDKEGNLIYTKMGNNDIRVNTIMANLRSGKKKEFMLLEGKRLIKEALETGCKLEYILFSRLQDVDYLKPYLPKNGGQLFKMPYRELQSWSDLTTNPGIMGIFQIPQVDLFEPEEALPLTIICDNIREPNNLGAILRTSSGVGCEQVILTKGCVNLWERKVLRSACGAHFRLKISNSSSWDDLQSKIPENANIFIADNNTVSTKKDNVGSLSDLTSSVPVLPYFSTNFKLVSHIVLIVGGETEGISGESYQMASKFNGARLNVPLSNGVDSLNTGTALGVIAFEIKRQLSNFNENS